MKTKSPLVPILISLIPLGLIILNVLDIQNVFSHPKKYPFGSEFFSPASIYQSQTLYVSYYISFTLLLIVLIYLAFARKWKYFWLIFAINFILFLYPVLTNTQYFILNKFFEFTSHLHFYIEIIINRSGLQWRELVISFRVLW